MATKPLSDLTATWNAGGTTFTAIKMNVTDTASAAGSMLLDLQVGGTSRFTIGKTGGFSTTGSAFGIYNNGAQILMGGAGDLILTRDAANTLAQRNGTNAQAFRLYNTYTDASNYERLDIRWVSNSVRLETQKAGTGTARNLILGTDASARWVINGTTGHFIAGVDNTYDIGESGANRPRNVFAANNLTAPYLLLTSGGGVARAYLAAGASDVIQILLAAGTPGGALEFTEMTAPAAPATNSVRIYAEDNGSGKTRLMARFATGAAVQIAIEP